MDTTSPEGFLYQGGYLSIKAIEDNEFTLDYPNTEVLNSMSRLLAMNMLNGQDVFGNLQRMALRALKEKDVERIVEALNCLLSSIPYDDYKQTVMDVKKYNGLKISVGEYLYRSTILSFLRGCSVTAVAEMHTDKGRPDLVVSYKGNIYVIEMKVAEKPEEVSSKLKQAIAQMRDGNYLGAYPGATGLALVIDDTKRQITQSETVV
jgi:predicted HAD superfamily phosphohydrolase